jgi:uncharacterized membrane protein
MARLHSRNQRLILVALAVTVFLWSWAFLDHSFYAHRKSTDVVYYQGYVNQIRVGQLPYRDFTVQYPPGALAVFLAPTVFGHSANLSNYEKWFARLMCALGLTCLLLVALARPPLWGLALVAVSPLLFGNLGPERYDLWPTALTTASIVAFLHDRHRLGWAALAAGFAAKLFPLALIPLCAVWTYRRRGAPELVRGAAIAAAVLLLAFGPFVLLAPHGLWSSIWGQASRPIQIESLAASYLMTFHHPHVMDTYGTEGISGHHTIRTISFVAQLGVLIWIWVAFALGEASRERFVRFVAAAVCAFIAFGAVFSPQYLIWLVPLVALVRGARGMVATATLVVAFICTDIWYGSQRYWDYVDFGDWGWLVLMRNLIVVSLIAVLAMPVRWRPRTWSAVEDSGEPAVLSRAS